MLCGCEKKDFKTTFSLSQMSIDELARSMPWRKMCHKMEGLCLGYQGFHTMFPLEHLLSKLMKNKIKTEKTFHDSTNAFLFH